MIKHILQTDEQPEILRTNASVGTVKSIEKTITHRIYEANRDTIRYKLYEHT